MPVDVSFGFLSMLCIMGWLDLNWSVWFLSSIILHELGHLLVLFLFRIPVVHIRVRCCGAVICAQFPGYWKELLCAAAGPAVSLLTAFAIGSRFWDLKMISFFLGMINLLPLYPLDGGRMLRCGLLLCCGEDRSDRIVKCTAYAVGSILLLLVCWGTIVLQAGVWPIFLALALLWRTGENEK